LQLIEWCSGLLPRLERNMPTIYQTCGTAIEKIGPSDGGMSGRGRPIAFCADRNTADLFVDALKMLDRIHAFGYTNSDDYDAVKIVLTRAGLI
jgi:hypothetical protein